MIPTIELVLNILAGVTAGVGAGALVSVARKLLDRVHLRSKLSVEGQSIEIDVTRLDELKHFVLSLMDEPQVFIAYSFRDTEYARRLAGDLREKGLRVWIAEEEIRPGDSIQKKIEDALQTSGYLLALLSRASLDSKWVQNEYQMALLRESRGKWPRVIPVLIESVDVPAPIRDKMYVDLTHDYDLGVERIVSAITDSHGNASSMNHLPTKASSATK